ncbi:hypothetical protein EJ04DRAFT_547621 [Polyplosphaeria fusca]|uniref:Dynamin N-terminal domain-containing protein n=1 Tax=Polyplosphaeria fusca TaxID=682080 RepID=A0A9P4RBU4_9PLEO|nr:hypothetical protein EJ04DRAFT_547621 [Polyplosphaeria fusca]
MATGPEVMQFEPWNVARKEQKAANKLAHRRSKKITKCAPAYDMTTEQPPYHVWYRMDKPHMNEKILRITEEVMNRITSGRPEDKELVQLREAVDQAKEVTMTDAKPVAVVGQQAMGKSLLINALLHRRDLSKTSASGGACTATAIKYLHKPDASDFSETYDAAVQFMDDLHLTEVMEEHARRYHHFHFSGKVDPEYHDEEERDAATAEEYFALLFNVNKDERAKEKLSALLTASKVKDHSLVEESLRMAHLRIHEAKADKDRIVKFDDQDIASLMSNIEHFVAQEDDCPALWPIVQYVNIFMGGTLVRNRVSIIDLPGLGDLNQSRTAATNAIRRKADFEIIVAKSDRVTTEEVVHQQIKQSIKQHGAKNTILVLTKIDEFFLDNQTIDKMIDKDKNDPFPQIKQYLLEAEHRLDALTHGEQNPEEEFMDPDETEDAIEEYEEYLRKMAQCTFIRQRAEMLEEAIRQKFKKYDKNPIQVFSVSASMYLDWMKFRQKARPVLSPEMTGIPKLRQFLLGLAANQNWRNYKHHVSNKLPLFLDKVARIAYNEQKDDAYAVIRPIFSKLVEDLKEQHQTGFDDFVGSKVAPVWGRPYQKTRILQRFTRTVQMWGMDCRWNTYNKGLRECGIVKRTAAAKYKGLGFFNWNEELSLEIQSDMKNWNRKMLLEVTVFARERRKDTEAACSKILQAIMKSTLSPPCKAIAIEEWKKRQEHVLATCPRLEADLKNEVKETFKYATTETDARCMIATIYRPLYEDVESMPRSQGWYQQQQRPAMEGKLIEDDSNGDTIIDRIAKKVDDTAKKELEEAFGAFFEGLIRELELFDEHISDRLVPDYAIIDTDREIRESLKDVLPELKDKVKELQDYLDVQGAQMELMDEETDEETDNLVDGEPMDEDPDDLVDEEQQEIVETLPKSARKKTPPGERDTKRIKIEQEAEDLI